ncbi:MAG: PDZ domain-containing protein [Acidobacteriota bacterium]|nr:PDZ domain-containing protein [Acidobacteriota bacterium]
MFKLSSIIAVVFLFIAQIFAQSNKPMLVGRVAVNQNKIAFTYAGKIWLVDRNGGAAKRLTGTPNEETDPVFSPDGKSIAFSRLNGGDWDVYVASADGGEEARRITLMPENDYMVAWTPDGKEVVFETSRDEEGVLRFYKMSVENPTIAAPLPIPQGLDGSFSPDGKSIAYNPREFLFGEWRYYRGGMIAPIWITDLQTGATEKLPNQNFNDKYPMWIGDKIYFVSDRTGIPNLFIYDRQTKQAKQLTKFDGQGIRHASASGSAISFVQDGKIHLFDLAMNQDKIVNVSVSPDTSELLPRNANAMRFLEQSLPSANGEKIAFGARGEVLIFDAKSGEYKNLTNTSGAAERYPTISPDNKSVAYFSDESGEYALHIRSLENDSVKKITIEKQPSFYWNLTWSPDSKKLAFNDRRLNLWLADADNGTTTKIDASDYSAQDNWSASFSPDSRFLTYAKRLKNRAGTIFIYDAAQRKSFQITDGKMHAEQPVFDASGKYLYFASSPNALTSEFDWAVLNGEFARPLVVSRVYALVLSNDSPTPFLPNGQPNSDAKVSEPAPQTKIDFTNLEKRFVNLPLPTRDYARLDAGRAGRLFLTVGEWSKTPGDFNSQQQSTTVYSFDLAKGGEMQKIVEDIGDFDLTRDGSKLLYRKGRDWFLVDAETAPKAGDGKLDLSKMEVKINPAEEWRQVFHESMRIMRDWFYDPNYHGQNLTALENYYAAYLPTVTRRSDLNSLMGRMLGSVSVSHFRIGGGDAPQPAGGGKAIGLLGADYAIENGHYRFKKIYRSTSYAASNGSFSAPLDAQGVDVREGDYLLEVNGNKVEATKNILSYFEDTVRKPTRITVSQNSDGSNSRTYTIYPSNGENRLRRANWAEENRKLVDKLSGGKLGYIFIEGYGGDGLMNAIRGLTGYADKAGIIIDQRFNGGGITPDYLIEMMLRKPLYYYRFRGGEDLPTPVNPAPPVKVMLINEWNGSAAETGAFMFKLGKVGTIVGKRTIGAGIGPYFFTPGFVDGGRVQLPNRAAYNPDGTSWGIENYGVEPDVDIEIMPQDLIAGRDAQLEKAVEVAMMQIQKNPIVQPKRPAFPVHPGSDKKESSSRIVQPSTFALPGSAFPAPIPKPEVKPVTNGKFAAYLGQFDTPMGVITFSQEGDKLIGLAGGERIELLPDTAAKDKFSAQTASVIVTFERDASEKIISVTVIIPSGRELKGKKIN